MMTHIRPVGPQHLGEIARLVAPAFEELRLEAYHLTINIYEDPDFRADLCLGGFEGSELVGMAVAVPRGFSRHSGSAPVGHLKVLHVKAGPQSNVRSSTKSH